MSALPPKADTRQWIVAARVFLLLTVFDQLRLGQIQLARPFCTAR